MFSIQFNRITVSKASKYVLLIKNQIEIKRTEISDQWTSSPQFRNVEIDNVNSLQIKLCEATTDRKVKIIGIATIDKTQVHFDSNVLLEKQIKFEQEIQGKQICVGICHIKIAKSIIFEEEEITSKPNLNEVQEQDFQLKVDQNEEQQQFEDEVKIQVHCGFNFYLGSAFKVTMEWGSQQYSTRYIKDKINPIWAEGGRLVGNNNRPITIKVYDAKDNILESFQFSLQHLKTMFPYHIRLIFKEQFLGALPQIYISLLRDSYSKHSIMELPLKFGLKNLGQPLRNSLYMMISFSPSPKLPIFLPLDRSKYCKINQINDYLVKRQLGQEQRIDMIGLANSQTQTNFSIFKSYLNRKLYLTIFQINDNKACFLNSNLSGCKILQSKNDLQSILKKIYYHGQSFTFKKYLEIYNPIKNINPSEQKSAAERWKLLSSNYLLRNQLINTSIKQVQSCKQAIQSKGKQIVQLKKVLKDVRKINIVLVQKERLMNTIKNKVKSNKLYAKQIDLELLIPALFEKQTMLQGQKRINAELSLRLNSLTEVEQTQQDLDQGIIVNSTKLLKQQQQISKMVQMQKALERQRQIIGKLQTLFEKSEIDKKVNEALKEQTEKLNKFRERKQVDLKNIYNMVREQNKIGGNLTSKVKHAQETLIKLNEQYARLTKF